MGETASALGDADQSVSLRPRAGAYQTRGDVFKALGRKDEAVADYRKALEMDPDADTRTAVEAALRELEASP
jgi:predicted negative regulator of RcsB-dependent stress response